MGPEALPQPLSRERNQRSACATRVCQPCGGRALSDHRRVGGVFGLLLAFALYFPRRTVVLLFPPIPMPAWLFVTLYGVLELYLGVTGTEEGVAHFAHLGGMLGAWLLIRYWRGRPPSRLR